ncbi:alpha/beta hydrolase fold domain-containing protein [Secundilactobacillus folii]|uniref:Alpha/beta hydrolase fold domain-containing protein n=1 Tax=Secundilactobacillus folii TaxID=2678357 RepID=A0A7X2XWA6_9LACO|nr:alpha/beta hydrolase fold domain-containing protein [Secundilactobacillus folii]MTV82794.1 alpha/beta hydrolase fold domain-containing protein [Secundilactobacillus folii]
MSIRGDWLLFKIKRSRLKQQVAISFQHPSRRTDELDPAKFKKPAQVKVVPMEDDHARLITLSPEAQTNRHVVIFHGGAYTVPTTESHRQWMELIVSRMAAKATMLDFPLAPEHTAVETVPAALDAYAELKTEYPDDQFFWLADSSGAGLALVLLQQLRAKQQQLPAGTVLVSPWVDLAMRDPEIEARTQSDPELPLQAMRQVAANYAGNLVLDDPLVSPINGPLDHLGLISLWFGTTELLLPDHHRLTEALQQADGTQVDVHEMHNMLHDFLLWHNLPESRKVFERLNQMMTAKE